MDFSLEKAKIAVIGLGYVGLPLVVELSRQFQTVGYDIDKRRINELQAGRDSTQEVTSDDLASCDNLLFSNSLADIRTCNVYIVTVPTPINVSKQPDLVPLENATRSVGQVLKAGDVVIYESTVYPGVTEEYCVPILEKESGLVFNKGFFVGYSPERVNPGDKERPLNRIVKITAGSTAEVADYVDSLYKRIILAGTHKAPSIKVAEAAKVVENTQRDLNIALVNELAIIFNHLGIETRDVLDAASSKWNFLPFRPGLVGGHCIGVDPYYLIHRSQMAGYHPDVIMAGRRINDGMGVHVAGQIVKLMIRHGLDVPKCRILILGLTFKEDCPDIRNTKVADLYRELDDLAGHVDIHDPWADADEARSMFGISVVGEPKPGDYDAIVLAVAHKVFTQKGGQWIRAFGRNGAVVYDVKSTLPKDEVDGRL